MKTKCETNNIPHGKRFLQETGCSRQVERKELVHMMDVVEAMDLVLGSLEKVSVVEVSAGWEYL
jgi:hypothetical protein